MRTRRRYHLRAPAFVYIAVTMLIALGALNSQNNLLFWTFGVALAVVLVSGVVSGSMLTGIEVHREPMPDVAAETPTLVRYRITNRNRLFPAFALSIEEAPSGSMASVRRLLRRGREAADLPVLPWTHFFDSVFAFAGHVGPRATVRVDAPVRASRRGRAEFGRIRVSSGFPFGLIGKSVYFIQEQHPVFTPAPVALPEELRRRLSAGKGMGDAAALARADVSGEEFFALREYIPGDRLRDIAWKPSARRGELLTRLRATPAARRLRVVLDLDPGAPEERAERAIRLAAAIIRLGSQRQMSVGLLVPEAGLSRPIQSSRWHADALLRDLALLELSQLGRGGRASEHYEDRRTTQTVVVRSGTPRWTPPAEALLLDADAAVAPDRSPAAAEAVA